MKLGGAGGCLDEASSGLESIDLDLNIEEMPHLPLGFSSTLINVIANISASIY